MGNSKQSYSRILKSSSIVGGAQGVNMLISMIRVKFVTLFLGPAGLGLLGIFQSIELMANMLSGLGLSSSGVRDVAEANGVGNIERVSKTVLTLRRLCWLTGLFGAVLLASFSRPLSYWTFHSDAYASHICWLSLAIFMASVSGGQIAVIQGMRRIADLSKLKILTAVTGTVAVIGLYWRLGVDGIVPAILTLAVVNLAGSYWFSRKIKMPKVEVSWRTSLISAGGLIVLGLAVMWDGLLAAVVEYITRVWIARELDLVAVGLFTAAFRLSGMFLNFILNAMGADFYPSLMEVSGDDRKMSRLVSQQTEIGLLLAGPGLLATLTLAPWAIRIFYSGDFDQASDLLQWFVLGCMGRVVAWPMAFVLLAKGKSGLFFLTQTVAYVVHLVAIWMGLKWIGIEGVAVAFLIFNTYYAIVITLVSWRLIGYKWSLRITYLSGLFFAVAALMMVFTRNSSLWVSTVGGVVVTTLIGLFSLRSLCSHLDAEHAIVRMARKLPLLNHLLKSI